jgi:hypothetical protein
MRRLCDVRRFRIPYRSRDCVDFDRRGFQVPGKFRDKEMTHFTSSDGRNFRLELPARAASFWTGVELDVFNSTSFGNRSGPDPLAAANG